MPSATTLIVLGTLIVRSLHCIQEETENFLSSKINSTLLFQRGFIDVDSELVHLLFLHCLGVGENSKKSRYFNFFSARVATRSTGCCSARGCLMITSVSFAETAEPINVPFE